MLKQTTDQALRRITRETKTLTISKDDGLGEGDIKLIADVIRQAPYLESLTIKNCGLRSEDMQPLVDVILEHPSLSVLDFSGNAFTSLDFALPLVGLQPVFDSRAYETRYIGNPRIHSLDLSGNTESLERGTSKSLLQASFANDHMAILRMPSDPWETYGNSFGDAIVKSKNIVGTGFSVENPTTFFIREALTVDEKNEMLDRQTSKNLTEAQAIWQRIETAEMISTDDIAALNGRLPAVLYLAVKKMGRVKALEALIRFHDRAADMTGEKSELKKYLAPIPDLVKTLAVPSTFAPVNANASDIANIVNELPECTRQTVRNEIDMCRSNPTKCMDLAGDTMRAVSKVSTTALTVMTSLPNSSAAVPMLDSFTESFKKVVRGVEAISGQKIDVAILAAAREVTRPQKKGFWANLLDPDMVPEDFPALAPKAEMTAELLRKVVPAIHEITTNTDVEIQTTQTIVDTFDKIKDRLQIYFEVGHEVVADWKSDYHAKHPETVDGEEPFYLRAMAERLAFLQRAYERVGAHRGSHIMHAELLQRQSQQGALITEHDLPLLGATVEGFDVLLQRTRPGTTDAKGLFPAIRAIDAQSKQLLGALAELDQAGERVRDHVSELFLDRALSVSGSRTAASPHLGDTPHA